MAQTPTTESGNKIAAGLRYGGAGAFTVFGFLGAVSLLSPEDIATLKAQVDILNQSILTGYGALSKMGAILGPVGVIVMGWFGVKSSTVQSMARKLLSIAGNAADPASTQAKVEVVNIAANKSVMGEGAAVIAPAIADDPNTAANVVSTKAEVPK